MSQVVRKRKPGEGSWKLRLDVPGVFGLQSQPSRNSAFPPVHRMVSSCLSSTERESKLILSVSKELKVLHDYIVRECQPTCRDVANEVLTMKSSWLGIDCSHLL